MKITLVLCVMFEKKIGVGRHQISHGKTVDKIKVSLNINHVRINFRIMDLRKLSER